MSGKSDTSERSAGIDRRRLLTFLADFNRSEFRRFDATRAGIVGCGASAAVVLLGVVVAWLAAGWSWWLLAGAGAGGALVWPATRLVDGQTFRAMARRLRETAEKKGIPFDEAAFRAAALAEPGKIALSYRELGFVFRILRALRVPPGEAQGVADRLDQERAKKQSREAAALAPELFEDGRGGGRP